MNSKHKTVLIVLCVVAVVACGYWGITSFRGESVASESQNSVVVQRGAVDSDISHRPLLRRNEREQVDQRDTVQHREVQEDSGRGAVQKRGQRGGRGQTQRRSETPAA